MKLHTILSLAFCAITGFAFGQTVTTTPAVTPSALPPATLPLTKAELTAYANGQADQAYLSHGGISILQKSGSVSSIHKKSNDIGTLIQEISTAVASFDVTSTTDSIWTWVQVANKNGDPLYEGYRNAPPEKVGASWKLSSQSVKMQLAYYIPIRFPGSWNAQLVTRDANRNVTDIENIRAENGYLYFPSALAGWGSELTVSYNTGNGYASASYSVADGGNIMPEYSVTGNTVAYIENQVNFSDAQYASGVPVSIYAVAGYNQDGTSGSPLVHVKLASARSVRFEASAYSTDSTGSPVVRPSKYTFFQFSADGVITNRFELPAVNGVLNTTLPLGTYEVVPDFGDYFEPETRPYYYSSSSVAGKG